MNYANSVAYLKEHGIHAIPHGWYQSRVKYLGVYINGYPFKPDDWGTLGRPILRIQNLSSNDTEANRYNGELPSRYLIKDGDILISWSASLGVYTWLGEESWLNQHIFKVEPNQTKVSREFFPWLAEWFISEMDREVHGSTMQHLTANAFGGFPVLLPPLSDQKIIAVFLERETAQLDELIASKEQLLELLAEKRRALIARAVTRGLDPEVSLRDSGIPWLGKIPIHWSVIRLRWIITNLEQGWSPQADDRKPEESEWGVVKLNSVNQGVFDATKVKTLPSEFDIPYNLELHTNDFLLTRSNTPELVGDVCVITDSLSRLIFSDLIYRLTLQEASIDKLFLNYFLLSFVGRLQIEADAKGTSNSMVKIAQEDIKDWQIIVPPLPEQRAIVVHIQHETAKLDALKQAAERAIGLLKERRAALITAAVTGKIKTQDQVAINWQKSNEGEY